MNVAPNDRGKVAGLLVAVVVMICFMVWRISSVTSPDNTPRQSVKFESPEVTVPAVAPALDTASSTRIRVATPAGAGQIDPFRDVLMKDTPTPPPAPARPVRQITGTLPRPIDALAIVPEAPQLPHLTGVVSGDPATGIFVVNGKDEVVNVGGRLSTGYVLVSIEGSSALVRRGKITTKILVGPSK